MKARAVLFWLAQLSWGFFQTLAGALMCLTCGRCRRAWYHGACVTYWNRRDSVSLGALVFIGRMRPQLQRKVLVHEFGHCVQSLLLGPLFLPLVGLPSGLWALCFSARSRRSYYAFLPERWANRLGRRVTGEEPPTGEE